MKFKIIGLGFKLKRIFLIKNSRYLKLNLGFSHNIFYKLPLNINVFIKKKIFLLHGYDITTLFVVIKKLLNIRVVNPYKEKGILLFYEKLKLKKGKQQQK
jgi:ribosomal protein L6P/L9E